MRAYNRSWRWLIARSLIGVLIAFGFAWFFYPHLLPWLVLGAMVIACVQVVARSGLEEAGAPPAPGGVQVVTARRPGK